MNWRHFLLGPAPITSKPIDRAIQREKTIAEQTAIIAEQIRHTGNANLRVGRTTEKHLEALRRLREAGIDTTGLVA